VLAVELGLPPVLAVLVPAVVPAAAAPAAALVVAPPATAACKACMSALMKLCRSCTCVEGLELFVPVAPAVVVLLGEVDAVAAAPVLVPVAAESICCSVWVMSWNRLPPLEVPELLELNRLAAPVPFAVLLPRPESAFWPLIWLSQAEFPQMLLIDIVLCSLGVRPTRRAGGKMLPPQASAAASHCSPRHGRA
jgi:hypothetical protein